MGKSSFDSWMWERANDLLDELERLQRQFWQRGGAGLRPAWQPPVDVFETRGKVWVVVAVPGVDPSSVEVVMDPRGIVVRGTRSLAATLPEVSEDSAVHRMELPHGYFERRVELPPGAYEPAERRSVHGCLVLSFRRVS